MCAKKAEGYIMVFSTEDELKEEVEKLVPQIFIDILEKNRGAFNKLPFLVQREMSAQILILKNLLVERLIKHISIFRDGTLDGPTMAQIVGDCLTTLEEDYQ